MPPTATPESSFSETAVFGDPVAQQLLPLTNGRFAIQTVHGFAIYDEADLMTVAQSIPVEPPGWPNSTLSASAEHLVWRDKNGRLFVQRLADEATLDEAILLEVPGNPNGWDHPSFHLSPQGNFGWLFDGEAYSDEPPVVTLYRLQDGAELVQFRGGLPQFTSDEAFFVRDTAEGLLIYDTTRLTEPLYTVPRDEEISIWDIDLTADWLQITKYLRAEKRPFVELRDVATGELLHTHVMADDETRVTPSPDGQSLAVTFKQDDGADSPTVVAAGVRLYTVSGELRHEFLAPQISPVPIPSACAGVWTSRRSDPVYSLVSVDFAPDGRSLNVTYNDYVATPVTHLYATDSGEKLAEFTGHESLFVANGRSFISLSTDGLVQQWDTATPDATPQTIARYGTPITDLALSNNGELAALVNETGAELRRTADGELIQQYAGATAVTFDPDDQTIVLGFVDGRIQWRSLADDSLLSEMSDYAAPIRRLAYWPNQPEPTVLALAENDCRVTRWQLATGRQLEPLHTILTFDEYGDVIQMSIDDFTLSPTGNLLAGRSWFMYGFGVWDLSNDSNILTELEDQPLGVRDLAFSADGRLLATGEAWPLGGWVGPERGGLRLWQIDEDNVSLRWSTELDQFVGAVAFSNNSSLLAVGYSSGDVTLVNTHLEQFVGRLETVSGVTGLAFAADGRLLAATTRDGLTHIWQTGSP
ncbi:MAG: hypothetical protein CL608_01870 [Anaerolineaceae bacterium]|nr:hypothetical protein [Anaerolineaceae bacterium]